VAYSLKARLYMHWVEAQGVASTAAAANTACAGNCLTKALAAAQNGINSAAGNWTSVHTGASTETNWWFQFNSERSGYTAAGRLMVDSLKGRGDPRLEIYFDGTAASIVGSKPGESNGAAAPLNTNTGGIAAADAGIPLVTCSETQFIIAEALYRQGAAAAQVYSALNAGVACQNARFGTGTGIQAVQGLTGAALLHEIMMQKYFALFLNMESFNDYKRTCEPNVAAAVKVGGPLATKPIPGRLLYGQSERQSNSNLSAPGTGNNGGLWPSGVSRNRNDPITCATQLGLPGA
jgi:hypothetical protein